VLVRAAGSGIIALLLLTSSGIAAPQSRDAFPGRNGLVLFGSAALTGRCPGCENIYTTDLSATPRRLTNNDQREFTPTWSPDGRTIAYVDTIDFEIHTMRADGSGKRTRTRGADVDAVGWSPDGSRFVVAAGGSRGPPDLYVIEPDGRQQRRLTRTPAIYEGAPAWSPDGSRIAFLRGPPPGAPDVLYLINADGSGLRRIATRAGPPAWSPDGRQLYHPFAVGRTDFGPRNLIRVVGIDPPKPARVLPVVDEYHSVIELELSPDGTRMLASVEEPTPDPSTVTILYSFAADGSDPRRIEFPNVEEAWTPSWQPVCTLYGTERADIIQGTPGPDKICALGGNDVIRASGGDDVVLGGPGDDCLDGGYGNDWLFGGAGDDTILARYHGRDIIDGGPGADTASADRPTFDTSRDVTLTQLATCARRA
jgi:Tol biopolymer transport system component